MIDEKAMSLIPTYAQTKIPHREEATETMFARLMNHAAEKIRVGFIGIGANAKHGFSELPGEIAVGEAAP